MATEPENLPEWASEDTFIDGEPNVIEPPQSKKDFGWGEEIPGVQYQNWWQRLVYRWLQWLKDFHFSTDYPVIGAASDTGRSTPIPAEINFVQGAVASPSELAFVNTDEDASPETRTLEVYSISEENIETLTHAFSIDITSEFTTGDPTNSPKDAELYNDGNKLIICRSGGSVIEYDLTTQNDFGALAFNYELDVTGTFSSTVNGCAVVNEQLVLFGEDSNYKAVLYDLPNYPSIEGATETDNVTESEGVAANASLVSLGDSFCLLMQINFNRVRGLTISKGLSIEFNNAPEVLAALYPPIYFSVIFSSSTERTLYVSNNNSVSGSAPKEIRQIDLTCVKSRMQ